MWNIVATLPLCLFSIWNCHGFVNAGDMLVSTPDPTCAIISINSRWHQLESGCGLWMDFTAMLGDVFSIFSILNNTFNPVRGGGFVNTKSETKKGSGTLLVMLYKDTAKSWDIYNWVFTRSVLHSSRIAYMTMLCKVMQGCGQLFHMLILLFSFRHFVMESVPNPCLINFPTFFSGFWNNMHIQIAPSVEGGCI